MTGCTHHANSANETAPLNNQSTTKLLWYPNKTFKLRSEPVQVVVVYIFSLPQLRTVISLEPHFSMLTYANV